ncbi:hypothetical protein AGDE_13787 [Angomonas deanei]|uniref:LRAT domain-containing protein n=1 Tax=Angomonas deanei TaxID=59799 RepID=A0A7G2CTM3_9TRYP|nr:hypothetical protein AGDE_13787 [Angomonas deanei]CAD2222875.1 hypothetical protein, conserved [Angomonas deanei]|eukprot:EPY21735.1 hypothetical protein AGDE_13787 [Angomonas deanei]
MSYSSPSSDLSGVFAPRIQPPVYWVAQGSVVESGNFTEHAGVCIGDRQEILDACAVLGIDFEESFPKLYALLMASHSLHSWIVELHTGGYNLLTADEFGDRYKSVRQYLRENKEYDRFEELLYIAENRCGRRTGGYHLLLNNCHGFSSYYSPPTPYDRKTAKTSVALLTVALGPLGIAALLLLARANAATVDGGESVDFHKVNYAWSSRA